MAVLITCHNRHADITTIILSLTNGDVLKWRGSSVTHVILGQGFVCSLHFITQRPKYCIILLIWLQNHVPSTQYVLLFTLSE